MKKISLGLIIILSFIIIFGSCKSTGSTMSGSEGGSWDSIIPPDNKATILFIYLTDIYHTAVNTDNIKTLMFLPKEFDKVAKLNPDMADDVQKINNDIQKNIDYIKNNKIKAAKNYESKKDYLNASYTYIVVLEIDPKNADANNFFKKNKKDIDVSIKSSMDSIKKALDNGNFQKALTELNKIAKVQNVGATKNKDFDQYLSKANELKDKELKTFVTNAKARLTEKKYDKAMVNAKLALDIDKNNAEAEDIYTKAKNAKRIYDNKKKATDATKQLQDADGYFTSAQSAYDSKNYVDAKAFIKKYLSISNDDKGKNLDNLISQEISNMVTTILGDAILRYNDQQFDNALKLFKQVLALDPTNDDALEYKSRIERRIEALDNLNK